MLITSLQKNLGQNFKSQILPYGQNNKKIKGEVSLNKKGTKPGGVAISPVIF